LRRAKITLPKREYMTGENVEGFVVITCDKPFKANSVGIKFIGREHTRIVVSDGDSSTTYREEKVYCDQTLTLREEGEIEYGETRLPFDFKIPENTLSTYHGTWGNVEYTLEAKIDIPWAFDVVSRGEIDVKNFSKPPKSNHIREISDSKEFPDLQVEVASDVVCIGDELRFKVCTSDAQKMRGLKVEVVNREWAKAKRVTRDGDNAVLYKFFPKENIRQNSWITMRLKTGPRIPPTFDCEIMTSKVFLKVTIDIPWAFDTSIYVPIHTLHCPSILEDDGLTFESMF